MSRRSDAGVKLRGAAVYGPDFAVEGMLHAALVPAPLPHGRLRTVDVAPALRLPGVVAAVGPSELPALLPGRPDPERPLFPMDEILYYGQPVAAVAARTPEEAIAGARAVRVDAEPLPVLADLEEAFPSWPEEDLEKDPRIVAHVLARHGDIAGALRTADFVHAETYRTTGVHQVALEPHACVAQVDGKIWRVTTTTQTPFGVREDLGDLLGLPLDRIVVTGTWVGGGFGGKGASFLEPCALILAAATGRPVRLALSYREEFQLGRTTLPSVVRIESAVRDGRITARRVRLMLDSGASLPGRDFATGYAIAFLLGPYDVGAFEMEGYAVRTNKPPFGPHRAPFAPQCAFVVESHTDAIARRLGVDPVEFRLQHAWSEGATTPLGQPVRPTGLKEGLERARRLREEWRRSAPPGHGFGVACGFWSTGTGAGGEARLRLTPKGLTIVEGEREIGSGSVVGGLVEVAARVTGLPKNAIDIEYRSTADAPYDTGVFGSRTVGALGRAVGQAAERLLQSLQERSRGSGTVRLALERRRVVVVRGGRKRPLAELLTKEEAAAGGLEASGRHYGRSGSFDTSRIVSGTFYPYTDFTATVTLAEVDVDRETGQVRPVRLAAFPDVGVALDPGLVRAQVEGAVAMGVGSGLFEEMLWGTDGRLVNPGLLDYRLPTILDVPEVVVDLVEGFHGAGPFGAKGVGEPCIIPVPAALANAVTDATGSHVTELPLTPERVARALKLL